MERDQAQPMASSATSNLASTEERISIRGALNSLHKTKGGIKVVVLQGTSKFLLLFGLAAGLGGIGGFVFQLIQTRGRGQTGQIEKPHGVRQRYIDLGIWADVIVGAVASVAAVWAFPPEAKNVTTAAGLVTTTTEFDVVRVVGLSLIVGSAGSSFLSSLQAKALALVKTQEAAVTKQVAATQVDHLEGEIRSGATKEHLLGSVKSAKASLNALA